MQSATKPYIIPCECYNTIDKSIYNTKILYKLDDIRKDLIITKCKCIISQILSNASINNETLRFLPIIMYRVQPITKSAGFIELINGDTLSIITDIKNYLLEKRNNKNGLHDFIKSVAVSTILVYIFGIGDRHKENILITNDGLLVDIDFGFLEGQDTMRCAYSRIPEEILNFNNRTDIFMDWCKCLYLELRRYAIHFHSLFMLLHTANEDDESILNKYNEFIIDRFSIDLDEQEAINKLEKFIENSKNSSLNTTIRDSIHESSKVISNIWNNLSYESIVKWWSNELDEK